MKRLRRRASVAAVPVTVLGLMMSSMASGATPVPPSDDGSALPSVSAGQALPTALPQGVLDAVGNDSITLTLLTGDTVEVQADPEGHPEVRSTTPMPRAGGTPVVFHTVTRDGNLYVVPDDALPLLGDVLDWELFNVAKLAEHVANGTVDEVPAIITHTGAAGVRKAPDVSGATVERRLEAIDADAVTISGDGAWWRNVAAASRSRAADPLPGVDKVWLNELAHVTLDESVPQIGAPAAWSRGLDGTGVTVAVLDTGIDATHPDVAGKVVEMVDFTGNARGPIDGHGHGTHVASTIAGTGAASDGLRRGVAPGASLRIGKVCGDGGSCSNDAIIAGMEWAARSGAPVVNLSLGGAPTDGTDPLSTAVNRLSAEFGTLFVIAAGNSGPDPYTVASPGAADEALTVAAVDKSGEMADFSSRGPRLGDDAQKPDIAAPGVAIVAARAAGTAMGTVVNDYYTKAGGTSMATPHVSGAAAIAAQMHPDLSGRELKQLLVETATDLGHDQYAQGAGLVDLANAVNLGIVTDGVVNFGRLSFGFEPVTDEITYTNLTDEPVTLVLDATFTAPDGAPAPAGLLSLGDDEVTVPARGTASVSVTLDGSQLADGATFGRYKGLVTGTDGTGTQLTATPVTALLESERFPVTVRITPPDGVEDVAYGNAALAPMDEKTSYQDPVETVPAAPEFTVQAFAGIHTLHAVVAWTDRAGEWQVALPVAPEVEVTGPTTVRLDLTEAEPLRTGTPEPAQTHDESVILTRTSAQGSYQLSSQAASRYGDGEMTVWLLPAGPVTTGTFTFLRRDVLVAPPVTMQAVGGAEPLVLDPRYSTADAVVWIGEQAWRDLPDSDRVLGVRSLATPIPRLDGTMTVPVVDAGSGTADELAAVDADGALVLMTASDVCGIVCDFEVLQERTAAAAAAGAVGVLVAQGEGRPHLGKPLQVDLCPGKTADDCPEVGPYSALPLMSLPAEQARALVSRLGRSREPVTVLVRAQAETSQLYALTSADREVPAQLEIELDDDTADRVEHRFPAEQPGFAEIGTWRYFDGGSEELSLGGRLPNVATQRSVTMLVAREPDGRAAIDDYDVITFPWAEDAFVVGSYPAKAQPPGPDEEWIFADPYESAFAPPGPGTFTWHYTGPALPGAIPAVVTDSGWAPIQIQLCAGCREGNTLFPQMYVTNPSGYQTNYTTGVHKDRGALFFIPGTRGCEAPFCEITLTDQGGHEYEQTLTTVSALAGSGPDATGDAVAPTAPGGVVNLFSPFVSETEADR